MDAFESIVATILQREGYWIRPSFKVELTKEERVKLGVHSLPRVELDIVTYKGKENVARIVECKSYLDSPGVSFSSFNEKNAKGADRFKLLLREDWRTVVEQQLLAEFERKGLTEGPPKLVWCLAAAKLKKDSDQDALADWFSSRGWDFWGPDWIKERVKALAGDRYENDIATITSKLILREKKPSKAKRPVQSL